MPSLIELIRHRSDAADYLAWPGDFELDRHDHLEQVHLASGASPEGLAGDGAGGTYFFCGKGGEERPILYADSEGGAALVAVGLPELLQLLLVAPWWHDLTAFTTQESHALAAEYVADMPDLAQRRDRAAVALGLHLPADGEVLARLREVALGGREDYVLIFTPEGNPYRPLIGAELGN